MSSWFDKDHRSIETATPLPTGGSSALRIDKRSDNLERRDRRLTKIRIHNQPGVKLEEKLQQTVTASFHSRFSSSVKSHGIFIFPMTSYERLCASRRGSIERLFELRTYCEEAVNSVLLGS